MSSNKLIYDPCFIKKQLQNYEDTMNYNLYPGKIMHQNPCQMNVGIVGGNDIVKLPPAELANVESSLYGITRPLSNCDEYAYTPYRPYCEDCDTGIPYDCYKCKNKTPLPQCQMFNAKPPMPNINYMNKMEEQKTDNWWWWPF